MTSRAMSTGSSPRWAWTLKASELLPRRSTIDGEDELVGEEARRHEVGLGMGRPEADAAVADEGVVRQPERAREPVLDDAVDHVEIAREVDDAGRVAMREAHRHGDAPGAGRQVRSFDPVLPLHAALAFDATCAICRSAKRWSLPVAVFGSSATNSMARGYL